MYASMHRNVRVGQSTEMVSGFEGPRVGGRENREGLEMGAGPLWGVMKLFWS